MQSGPSRLVKDEYTAGLSGNGMDMDTGELVTIQHHATSPRHHHSTIPHHHQQFQTTNIIINQGQSKLLIILLFFGLSIQSDPVIKELFIV